MQKFLFTLIIFILPTSLFASMPDGLLGYKLGMTCKNIVKNDDRKIEIYCTKTTKKIAQITVSFKSISYEEILKKIIRTNKIQPSEQIINEKVLGCHTELFKILGLNQNSDTKDYSFTGYTK